MLKALVLTLSLVAASALAQSRDPADDVRAARLSSNRAIQRHDIATFATTLDSDFVAVGGNGGYIASRQAYIDLFTGDFADAAALRYERTPDKVELSTTKPLAAESGHWVGLHPDGSHAASGTYFAMWRKTAEGWKLRSELFVTLN